MNEIIVSYDAQAMDIVEVASTILSDLGAVFEIEEVGEHIIIKYDKP